MDMLPTDRVVEIASYKRARIYGVGRWRATIMPDRGSRWQWRVWDVLDPSIGGEGTIASGVARSKMEAMECLELLRQRAGIAHVAEGGGGPVDA